MLRGWKMENLEKPLKFSRLEKMIGKDVVASFQEKSVLVLGCGGVGGYVVEALARSGVGTIIIVDYDRIDVSNINRQIIALDSTVGELKVDVLEKRVKDIHPECHVIKISEFIDSQNLSVLFEHPLDYLVDACDTVATKKEIIKECKKRNIPFISSMGTGNKLDPSQLEIVEIQKTVNDPLARILRKFVKDERIRGKVMVLSSRELPIKTGDRTPGSCAFVPSSAGLLIASYVIREFMKK